MTEAIDTVMSREQRREIFNSMAGKTGLEFELVLLQHQAEISFPKGIDKGRKEVVEWINERIDWKFALDAQLGGHISLNTQQWQAKLKEWGL